MSRTKLTRREKLEIVLEALSKVHEGRRPIIQTENGSGYINRDFKMVLSENGMGHHRAFSRDPVFRENNSLVEGAYRRLGEALDEYEPESYREAREHATPGGRRISNGSRCHCSYHAPKGQNRKES